MNAARRRQVGLGLSALVWALGGCSSAPPTPVSSATDRPGSAQRSDIALFALGLLDTPYSRGGRGPATGFDCSGLVSHVFREAAGMQVRGSSA